MLKEEKKKISPIKRPLKKRLSLGPLPTQCDVLQNLQTVQDFSLMWVDGCGSFLLLHFDLTKQVRQFLYQGPASTHQQGLYPETYKLSWVILVCVDCHGGGIHVCLRLHSQFLCQNTLSYHILPVLGK